MQDQGALTSVWGLLMSLWPEAEMRIQGQEDTWQKSHGCCRVGNRIGTAGCTAAVEDLP